MLTTNRPFIWIRFGENNKVLVNMWCSSEILLNHIISVCDIDPEITFDLCDTSGRLLGLSEAQTFQQTIQSLEGGAVYILVIIEDKSDQQVNVRPMLTNFEQYYPNLTDQILQNLHDKSERYTKKKHLKRTPLQAKVTTSRKVKK
ncbi:hypothetical protein EWB00_001977 [Schistosoma japonicum]|uniref:Uncharacterized protein n=1 Tax=Schistosoma japonicum TaxID=6182 RepID=A0A4Z2DEA6_SCHJA|nr:hypothetical protein EWB00_001977 [Schistosoma japonicum]